MCGIAGVLALDSVDKSSESLAALAGGMADRMIHRGPDGSGLWSDKDGAVALAHRRLAIVDLSELGRQPMHYADGRYTVAFNGEIYNFRELATELKQRGCSFRSSSDTEVLLAAVSEWGIEAALKKLAGMFAIALWDSRERVLHLARDRLGEKPLYLTEIGGYLYFASELRVFSGLPGFVRNLDPSVMAAYLRDGYVPERVSPYRGVVKLPPATFLSVPAGRGMRLGSDVSAWDAEAPPAAREMRPRCYWNLRELALAARSAPRTDFDTASAEFESLLRSTVRGQMLCDVPVGAFLSGGVDSSLVTAAMQAEAAAPVRTFTVAFDKPEYDESAHARAIANHLGTQHEQLQLSEAEILGCVPEATGLMDEPTANGSFFPVYLISKLARSRVTVVLSGDGGDEFFAGYNRYVLTPRAWQRIRSMPAPIRALARAAAGSANYRTLEKMQGVLKRFLPFGSQVSAAGALAKFGRLLETRDFASCYTAVTACWPSQSLLDPSAQPRARSWEERLDNDLPRMLLADQLDYLPGDNLAKLDRASMAVSLETRLPLLDHRIVEFSWRQPDEFKLRDGTTKRLMRSVLSRFVPDELINRPKMGFSVPTDTWLRGPLRGWAEDLLDSRQFVEGAPLQHDVVRKNWRDYLSRRQPNDYQMWAIVMLAAWMRRNG